MLLWSLPANALEGLGFPPGDKIEVGRRRRMSRDKAPLAVRNGPQGPPEGQSARSLHAWRPAASEPTTLDRVSLVDGVS